MRALSCERPSVVRGGAIRYCYHGMSYIGVICPILGVLQVRYYLTDMLRATAAIP